MIKRKGVTKGDMVRAIKDLHFQIQGLQRYVVMIDNVVDKYIHMNKDENKLKKYLEKIAKEKSEHKQKKRKSSGRSTKTSK